MAGATSHYLSKKRPDPDLDGAAAHRLDGLDPIMIKTIINEALIHFLDGREFLTYKDWLDAADERTMGLKQPIRSWRSDRSPRDGVPRGRARGRRALLAALVPDLEGDDHPARPCARLRAAEAARADLDVRALDRDPDHGVAGRARRREPVPGRLVDRSVLGSAVGYQLRDPLRVAVRDEPDQAHRAAPAGQFPPPRSWSRRTRCSTTCTPRQTTPSREGAGDPSPGQGPDRAGRADRRRARGVPGGRAGASRVD